ncbi:hypothetical protein SLNWT_6887 [Streptomyces albus]|uniref:Uncharacterized protein n=1 Tax=Streptomyces albus (strain ATCC 21838 / DSM 41398 / FERM P-419 / JCM 4703 / NBRC 107858) TaxID=1081613 RepID=A0A0B5EWT6_STRA4|nr:hypothetical protein SLNWT_6887 [Streptomyces albus]AOU81566.1 hypothetical protein SLNHY_6875 [Streptomyces albus]AYN37259.1 hypothetical protein DUI70_6766 [Streptomyces albus]
MDQGTAVAAQLVMAAGLLGIGWWGRRRAHELVPPGREGDEEREHRVAVLRRGALTCQLVGLLFVGATFAALV